MPYDILLYSLHKAQDGEKKNYRKFIQKLLMQDGNQQLKPNNVNHQGKLDIMDKLHMLVLVYWWHNL